MAADESQNFKLNRVILAPIGLWPLRHRVVQFILVLNAYGLILSVIVVQIAAIVKTKLDMCSVISILAFMMQVCVAIIKYVTFHVKAREIEQMREQQQRNWDALEKVKGNAYTIMQRYGNTTWIYTCLITTGAYLTLIIALLLQFVPVVRNLVVSANESQWYEIQLFPGEYFVDGHKYIIPICVHTMLVYFVLLSSVIGTEITCVIHLLHVCALFKVAGFFLETAIDDEVLQASSSTKSIAIHARIQQAIEIHKRAIEFAETIWSTFVSSYFVLTWLGVMSLGLSLFRLSKVLVSASNFNEIIFTLGMCGAPSLYMFISTFFGQKVKDHSAHVFYSACRSRWYEAPPKVRKLFLPVLLRSAKDVVFASGGMFVISLEGFTALMNMSVSYFMLLHSV